MFPNKNHLRIGEYIIQYDSSIEVNEPGYYIYDYNGHCISNAYKHVYDAIETLLVWQNN